MEQPTKARMSIPDPALLHIYGQYYFHDESHIVGNTAGLRALRDAIDRALNDPDGIDEAAVFAADGEGYGVVIIREDSSWHDSLWGMMAMPYQWDNWGRDERPDAIWPWYIVNQRIDAKQPQPDTEPSATQEKGG